MPKKGRNKVRKRKVTPAKQSKAAKVVKRVARRYLRGK